MFENFITIPCRPCNVYGDLVQVNPEHIVSVTLMPAETGHYAAPPYISIRLGGASTFGSSLHTTFESWEEWNNFTAEVACMDRYCEPDGRPL